jgi:hypothetical protein
VLPWWYLSSPWHDKLLNMLQTCVNCETAAGNKASTQTGHAIPSAGAAAGYTGWQGMAPQAKIAFQDLGSGSTGSINAPDDLANGYYQLSYSQ